MKVFWYFLNKSKIYIGLMGRDISGEHNPTISGSIFCEIKVDTFESR